MVRLVVVGLTVGILSVAGLSAAQDGWPVEQHCVGEPTAPPEGWTFEGTILMMGYAGIHAVQADWETPRVVVFLDEERDVPGGALSPNGRWYASPWGDVYETNTRNIITNVYEIRVHSTVNEREEYRITLPHTAFFGGTFSKVYWLDNTPFIFETGVQPLIVEINPFTGEISNWDGGISELSGDAIHHPYFSPDFTRYLYSGPVYDAASGEPLGDTTLSTYDRAPAIAWMQDSTHFAAEIQASSDVTNYQLALFDRDGKYVLSIFALPTDAHIRRVNDFNSIVRDEFWDNMVWSANGSSLAFNVELRAYPLITNLYIADAADQQIFDTCISTDAGLAWSPDGTQLALMAEGDGQRPILIYDVEQNELFVVGYHSGAILGWRAND